MRVATRHILTFFVGVFLASCGETKPSSDAVVGMESRIFYDESRENWLGDGLRPVAVTIWYPAADAVVPDDILIPKDGPIFHMGRAARGAEVLAEEARPLILLSHGTGGSALQMMWLGEALAKKGYIVAALNHHGNTAAEQRFDPRGFLFFWERPRDISVAIDEMLNDKKFGPLIDQNKIGALGFSLGGYTVSALAGARIDLTQFKHFCESVRADATCEPQGEYPQVFEDFNALSVKQPDVLDAYQNHGQSFKDSRIKAFVAIAPALGGAMTEQSLNQIDVPIKFIVGNLDQVAPAETNAKHIATLVSGAEYLEIPDAGHYSFLAKCTLKGRLFVPLCKESGSTNRDEIHRAAVENALSFFDANLGR